MEINNYYSNASEERVSVEIRPEYQVFVDLMRTYVNSTEDHKRLPSFGDNLPSLEKLDDSYLLNDEVKLTISIIKSKSAFLVKYNSLSFDEQEALDNYLVNFFTETDLLFIKRAEYSF
jgi:hypothetical protein